MLGKNYIFQPLKIYFIIAAVGEDKEWSRSIQARVQTPIQMESDDKSNQLQRTVRRVNGMQNVDNMTDFGRKLWIYHCFASKSDMLSAEALIII